MKQLPIQAWMNLSQQEYPDPLAHWGGRVMCSWFKAICRELKIPPCGTHLPFWAPKTQGVARGATKTKDFNIIPFVFIQACLTRSKNKQEEEKPTPLKTLERLWLMWLTSTIKFGFHLALLSSVCMQDNTHLHFGGEHSTVSSPCEASLWCWR